MIKTLRSLFLRVSFLKAGLLAGLMLLGMAIHAQSIWTNPITDANPSASNPYTNGQVVDPNITVSGLLRGSGIAAAAAMNRYNADGWTTLAAVDGTDFFEFSIIANGTFSLNLTSFVYTGCGQNLS